jgi:2-phosphosulfolactate phosphatase
MTNKHGQVAVVIDVFRSFTTACHVLQAGPQEYLMTNKCEVVARLGESRPDALLIGKPERGRQTIYNIPNSPTRVAGCVVKGRHVIHRCNAGAKGLLAAAGYDVSLAVCFANLSASAEWLKKHAQGFEIFPMGHEGEYPSAEDDSCRDALLARLRGDPLNMKGVEEKLSAGPGRCFFSPGSDEYPQADFRRCLDVDAVDFPIMGFAVGDYVRIERG